MKNEYIETIQKIGETSYESSKELADINTKVLEELGEQYIAATNLLMEAGTSQLNSLAAVKDYKEAIATQTEAASELSGKLLGIARNTADIATEYKDKCTAWYDKGVKESSAFVTA